MAARLFVLGGATLALVIAACATSPRADTGSDASPAQTADTASVPADTTGTDTAAAGRVGHSVRI